MCVRVCMPGTNTLFACSWTVHGCNLCVSWSVNYCLSVFLLADPVEELNDSSAQTATNSAAELLKQGAGTGQTNVHKSVCLFHVCVYTAHSSVI